MDSRIEQAIVSSHDDSQAGRIHFGQVVERLVGAGVEAYHVDYRTGRSTYYLPDGQTKTLQTAPAGAAVAEVFDAAAVQAAIRGAQRGEVMYPQFKQLTQAAGCASYMVWLAGRHVAYYGRRGETHVERFPD